MAENLTNLATKRSLGWTSMLFIVLLLLLQLGASFALADSSSQHEIVAADSHRHAPFPRSAAESMSSAAATTLNEGASYRPPLIELESKGGLILTKPINIYIIWYGAWAVAEKSVIRTALYSLTPAAPINYFPNLSNLWTVMTKYYQNVSGQATFATNAVSVVQEIDDGSGYTTINSTRDPLAIVIGNIAAGNLHADYEQGVYFVLTASDITYSDFPEEYCGYHNNVCLDQNLDCNSTVNNLVFAFVPMPTAPTLRGCNLFPNLIPGTPPNFAVSPGGELDSMVSVILHELLELTVDPYPQNMPAWIYNRSENSETADLCSYNFVAGEWFYCGLPSVYPDFNTSDTAICSTYGSKPANGDPPRSLIDPVTNVAFNQYGVGGSQYLVQKIWSLDNKGCVVQQEDACLPVTSLNVFSGNIWRGYFFDGVGLQTYAPGQNCTWQIEFSIQRTITFTFGIYALGYDDLDYIQVSQNGALVATLTGFGLDVVVTAIGTVFNINFVTDGSRSPYPISAGFSMTYTAV